MPPMEAFVTEGNVEIFLSRLHTTWNACDRDMLLRLLCQEQARMGFSRGHLKNGETRVLESRERLRKQREIVAQLGSQDQAAARLPCSWNAGEDPDAARAALEQLTQGAGRQKAMTIRSGIGSCSLDSDQGGAA
jgi:hypothetical protein